MTETTAGATKAPGATEAPGAGTTSAATPADRAGTAPADHAGGARETWLVVIDPQRIFGDSLSPWASPYFPEAMGNISRLTDRAGADRTVVTRWLPTADRSTAWGDYFAMWPVADQPADDARFDLVPLARGISAHPTVDEPTFGKWGPQLAGRVGRDAHLLITGVSTDCCVISTVLAAVDAGMRMTVVTDACAHSSAENGRAALRTMGLFPPHVDLATTREVLAR